MTAPRFTCLRSTVVSLPRDHVDTDQIIPAEFLKTTVRQGLGEGLFAHWRRDPDFVLHRPEARGAQVLLAGENFGCGSSREHAPWALLDYGFRCVIAPSLADIFQTNALRNGLLAIALQAAVCEWLADAVARRPESEVEIDLERSTLTLPLGDEVAFSIDAFARRCLVEGVDQLGYLLRQEAAIAAYEAARPLPFDTRRTEP